MLGTKHIEIVVWTVNRLRSRVALWWMHGLAVRSIGLKLCVMVILSGLGFDVIDLLLNIWDS